MNLKKRDFSKLHERFRIILTSENWGSGVGAIPETLEEFPLLFMAGKGLFRGSFASGGQTMAP